MPIFCRGGNHVFVFKVLGCSMAASKVAYWRYGASRLKAAFCDLAITMSVAYWTMKSGRPVDMAGIALSPLGR